MAFTSIKIPISIDFDTQSLAGLEAAVQQALGRAVNVQGPTINYNFNVDPRASKSVNDVKQAIDSLGQSATKSANAIKGQVQSGAAAGGGGRGTGGGGGGTTGGGGGRTAPPPGPAQGYRSAGGGQQRTFAQTVVSVAEYRVASRVTNSLFQAFDRGVSVVGNVQNELTQLNKVLNTSTKNLESLKSAAIATSKEFGKSTVDVLSGFKTFAQQGLPAEDVKRLGRTVALVSNVSSFQPNEIAEVISSALKNVGSKKIGSDALNLFDRFLAVEGKRAVSEGDLVEVFKRVGPQAAAAGIDIDQLNALTTVVKERTRAEGSEIATTFRFLIKNLQSTKIQKQLQGILGKGKISFSDASGDIRNTYDVLNDIATAFPKLSNRDQVKVSQLIGETRFASRTTALIKGLAAGEGQSVLEISQGASGEALKRNQIIMESLDKTAGRTVAAFEGLAITLGTPLIDPLKAVLRTVEDILNVTNKVASTRLFGGEKNSFGQFQGTATNKVTTVADIATPLLYGAAFVMGKRLLKGAQSVQEGISGAMGGGAAPAIQTAQTNSLKQALKSIFITSPFSAQQGNRQQAKEAMFGTFKGVKGQPGISTPESILNAKRASAASFAGNLLFAGGPRPGKAVFGSPEIQQVINPASNTAKQFASKAASIFSMESAKKIFSKETAGAVLGGLVGRAGAGVAAGAAGLAAGAVGVATGAAQIYAIGLVIDQVFKGIQYLQRSDRERLVDSGLIDRRVKAEEATNLSSTLKQNVDTLEDLDAQIKTASSLTKQQQKEAIKEGILEKPIDQLRKDQKELFDKQGDLLADNIASVTSVGGIIGKDNQILFKDNRGQLKNVQESKEALLNLSTAVKGQTNLEAAQLGAVEVLGSFSSTIAAGQQDATSDISKLTSLAAINNKETETLGDSLKNAAMSVPFGELIGLPGAFQSATVSPATPEEKFNLEREKKSGRLFRKTFGSVFDQLNSVISKGGNIEYTFNELKKAGLTDTLKNFRELALVKQQPGESDVKATTRALNVQRFKALKEAVDSSFDLQSSLDKASLSAESIDEAFNKAKSGDIVKFVNKDGKEILGNIFKNAKGKTFAAVTTEEGQTQVLSAQDLAQQAGDKFAILASNLAKAVQKAIAEASASFAPTGFGAGQVLTANTLVSGPSNLQDLSDAIAGSFKGFTAEGTPQFNTDIQKILTSLEVDRQKVALERGQGEKLGEVNQEAVDSSKAASALQVEAGGIFAKSVDALGRVVKSFEGATEKLRAFKIEKEGARQFATVLTGPLAKAFGDAVPQFNVGRDLADLAPDERAKLALPNTSKFLEEAQFQTSTLRESSNVLENEQARLEDFINASRTEAVQALDPKEFKYLLSSAGVGQGESTAKPEDLVNKLIETSTTGDTRSREDAINAILNAVRQAFQEKRDTLNATAQDLRGPQELAQNSLRTANTLSQLQVSAEAASRSLSQLERIKGFDNLVRAKGEGPLGINGPTAPSLFLQRRGQRLSQAEELNLSGLNQFETQRRLINLRSTPQARRGAINVVDEQGNVQAPLSQRQAEDQLRINSINERKARAALPFNRDRQKLEQNQQIASDFINTIDTVLQTKKLTPEATKGLQGIQGKLLNLQNLPETAFTKGGQINLAPFKILKDLPNQFQKILPKDFTENLISTTTDEQRKKLLGAGIISKEQFGAANEAANAQQFAPVTSAVGKVEGKIDTSNQYLAVIANKPAPTVPVPGGVTPANQQAVTQQVAQQIAQTPEPRGIEPQLTREAALAQVLQGARTYSVEDVIPKGEEIFGQQNIIPKGEEILGQKSLFQDSAMMAKATVTNMTAAQLQDYQARQERGKALLPRTGDTFLSSNGNITDISNQFKGPVKSGLTGDIGTINYKTKADALREGIVQTTSSSPSKQYSDNYRTISAVSDAAQQVQQSTKMAESKKQEEQPPIKVDADSASSAVQEAIESGFGKGTANFISGLADAFLGFKSFVEDFKGAANSVGGAGVNGKDLLTALTNKVSELEVKTSDISESFSTSIDDLYKEISAFGSSDDDGTNSNSLRDTISQLQQEVTALATDKTTIDVTVSVNEQLVNNILTQLLPSLESKVGNAQDVANRAVGMAIQALGNQR